MATANILCMKWGDKYGADYVNRLYGMIAANMTSEFELHCFTDNAQGILPQIRIHPLPALDLPPGIPERGWNKLATLQKGLGGLSGNALFLDLDVVITGGLEDFFEFPGKFAIIRDAKFRKKPIGNSSVYRFAIGDYQEVLDYFIENLDWVRKTFRNEQAYLSWAIGQRGELQFWPDGWCPSFKYHCVKPWPLAYFKDPTLPQGAKIVIFHGHPLPDEAIAGKTHNWYRPIRPTGWIKDYWRQRV